jgi:hypothetical protein
LIEFMNLNNNDLVRFSNVGQAFGSISAILSAIALIGVVASLHFQMRQAEVSRIEVMRNIRIGLLQFALDRPRYLAAWGMSSDRNVEENQDLAYASLVFGHLKTAYLFRLLTDFELNAYLVNAFRNDVVVRFWRENREIYLADNLLGRNAQRFARIVDSRYNFVMSEDRRSGVNRPSDSSSSSTHAEVLAGSSAKSAKLPVITGAALGVGIVIGLSVQKARLRGRMPILGGVGANHHACSRRRSDRQPAP